MRFSSMRFGLAAALGLVLACGGSSNSGTSSTPGSDVANQTFTGSLGDGTIVTLAFGGAPQGMAAPRAEAVTAGAVIAVTGTITVPSTGATIALTGSYDPASGALTVSGGGYTLTGTHAAGVIQGSATGPAGSVTFVVVKGDASAVDRYCGTYRDPEGSSGTFNLVVKGGVAFGVASGGVTFSGTVTGGAISMKDDKDHPIAGTVAGSAVSGTFQNSAGQGSWEGSKAACSAGTGGGGAVQGSCTIGAVPECDAYAGFPEAAITEAQASCSTAGGTWSANACSTANRAGTCASAAGVGSFVQTYYQGISATLLSALQQNCQRAGSTWTAG